MSIGRNTEIFTGTADICDKHAHMIFIVCIRQGRLVTIRELLEEEDEENHGFRK